MSHALLPYGECGEASAREKPLGVCRKNFKNYGRFARRHSWRLVKAVIFKILSDFDLARARGGNPLAGRLRSDKAKLCRNMAIDLTFSYDIALPFFLSLLDKNTA